MGIGGMTNLFSSIKKKHFKEVLDAMGHFSNFHGYGPY